MRDTIKRKKKGNVKNVEYMQYIHQKQSENMLLGEVNQATTATTQNNKRNMDVNCAETNGSSVTNNNSPN